MLAARIYSRMIGIWGSVAQAQVALTSPRLCTSLLRVVGKHSSIQICKTRSHPQAGNSVIVRTGVSVPMLWAHRETGPDLTVRRGTKSGTARYIPVPRSAIDTVGDASQSHINMARVTP